jgi:hypothetical protein
MEGSGPTKKILDVFENSPCWTIYIHDGKACFHKIPMLPVGSTRERLNRLSGHSDPLRRERQAVQIQTPAEHVPLERRQQRFVLAQGETN